MKMHSARFAGHGGMTLAADVGGDPHHPPVILMHGGGQTRHSWGKAARDLVGMGLRVISLDLRGHGESDWSPDGDYELDAFVRDLEAIIATLSVPVALVGASLGGVISLLALGKRPDLPVSALILVDVVPRLERKGVERIHAFMYGKPEGFANLEEAADAVAAYLPNRPRRADNDGLMKNLRARDDGRLYWHWDPKFFTGSPQLGRLEEMVLRMEEAARHIAVPTLIVRGRVSDVVSREGVAHLRELIPHAEYIDVEDAGHMVAGDKNDQFNAAVERFLASLALTP